MKKNWGRIALWTLLAVVLLLLLGFGVAWAAIPLDMQKLDSLSQASRVYDAEGREISQISGVENRTSIKLESVPAHVQNAFIAAEDARFYDHFGVDPWRMGSALISNIKTRSYGQGASTITQQLIKLTMLTSDKTIARKLQEMLLALKLERVLTKDQILERYLNTVYFGSGAYGVQSASKAYFGVDADKLTLPQGALLAAVIKSPSSYAPNVNPEKAKQRRDMILASMAENQFISEAEASAATDQPVVISSAAKQVTAYPWYVDQAIEEAARALEVEVDDLYTGGYKIYTALDTKLQDSADALFKNAANFPSNAADGTRAQAALIAADPQNGEILCLVGGREYTVQRGLNRATGIKRQPGSALKPISVYASAIDQFGYLPVSMVEDVQRDFGNGYSPRNVGGKYYGTVTLRESLARSLNAASVDLLTKTGIEPARRYLTNAGIELDARDNNLSLALGALTYGVSPMALNAAYAPLANGGQAVVPHVVRSIVDRDGATVYQFRSQGGDRVMREDSAYMLTSMLRSAVSYGSAQKLKALNFDVAGKTGTVAMSDSGNRDIWTVAYTPKVSVTVWMGFDQPDSAHKLSDAQSGSAEPCALATAFLKNNGDRVSGERFKMPAGLTEVLLDQRALNALHRPMLASSYTPKSLIVREIFPKGKAPTETSDVWVPPTRVFDLQGELTTPASARLSFTALQADAVYRLYRLDKDAPKLLGELLGEPGQKLFYDDPQSYEGAEYYVIPVHRELLSEGVLLEGKASQSVHVKKPFGFQDWIFFETPAPTSPPIPEETPLFADDQSAEPTPQATPQ